MGAKMNQIELALPEHEKLEAPRQSSAAPVHWMLYGDLTRVPSPVGHYLEDSEHGSVFQYPPWILLTAEKPDRYKVIACLADGMPVFAALLYMSPLPGLYAYKGVIERGPVFEDEARAIALWDDFESQLRKLRLCSLEISPFWERDRIQKLRLHLGSRGYIRCATSVCHTETLIVDLGPSEEEIFKSMKGSRNRIRKALSMGIQVREAQDEGEVKMFWQMYRDMCQSKELHCGPYRQFEKIWRFSKAYPSDCAYLLGWLGTSLVGGYILLRHGDIVEITRGGGSTSVDPAIPKSELIFWEAIRWAKQTGASVCDLGGVTPDAEEGSAKWNINRFKKKFSDQQISLFEPMIKLFNPRLYDLHCALRRLKRSVAQTMTA
jgi:lipid II:glycine glycyltransferase (peptidoglycan interpeptide bridge formation enzyme)